MQTIEVGNGDFSYDPNSTTLAVGSVIVFKFMSTNHTVGKAAFGVPCQPYDYIVRGAESFYSGVFNGEDTFSANVSGTIGMSASTANCDVASNMESDNKHH